MQYNNHHDSQDIVSLVGDMTGISTTAEIKQITRACNEANKRIWSWIFDAFGGWQFDASGNSDLPIATAALVANQTTYTLPSEALTVKAIEYKNAGGVWSKLIALPTSLINQHGSEKEFQDVPGEPRYYAPLGQVIKLYPASSESRAAALRVQFDRGATTFLSTDISKTPGFASEFHEAVAVGGAYFIAVNKNLRQVNTLKTRWEGFEPVIKKFYNKRFSEQFPARFNMGDPVSASM